MPDMIDVTAPKVVQIEVVTSPAGHGVLYVHIDGVTVLRVCRFKEYEYEDKRVLSKKKVHNEN